MLTIYKHFYLVITLLIAIHFPGQLDARVYFLHIPKTGGTTLRCLLEMQLSAEEIYPFRNSNQAKGAVSQELVSGHFPYWFCHKLDDRFEDAFKVTILRDPIERYLSFLRAKKKADIQLPDLESVLRLRQSPSRKYHFGLMDNALCRNLAVDPHLEGEALLESAKQTLHRLDAVLFFDHFTEDILALFQRLGINLSNDDIPTMNVTEKEPVSAHLIEEIKQLNKLDIQLYHYAKTCLQKKNTEYPLRTTSFESLITKSCAIDYSFNLPLNGRGWTYRDMINEEEGNNPISRWVMDQPAYIYFSLEDSSDYDLFFSAHPLTNEVIPRVSVNGNEIEIVRLNDKKFSTYHGIIPKSCLTHLPTVIAFYSSKAFNYRDIYPSQYNRNYPPLAFAVNRITLTPISQ
jgi:hypothetical protein